jgi:hypothetical protein
MPPQPITATVDPGRHRARVLKTAPRPRRDAAADQRHVIERHVGPDAHERVLVHEHALGEGAQMHELHDRRAVLRETRRLTGTAHRRLRRRRGSGVRRCSTRTCRRTPTAADDVIAGCDVAHLGADRLDDARGLVAEHRRGRVRERTFEGRADRCGRRRWRRSARAPLAARALDVDVLRSRAADRPPASRQPFIVPPCSRRAATTRARAGRSSASSAASGP